MTPGNLVLLAYQPKVYVSLLIALPCGFVGAAMKYYEQNIDTIPNILTDDAVFTMLTILVTFLAAFRVDAAYDKFWNGCGEVYSIIGNLHDATSDLIAFSRNANADSEEVETFHHVLIRLVSLLNSLIFAELESGGKQPSDGSLPTSYDFELIDIRGIEPAAIERLISSKEKVEVVYQWIMNLIIESWHKEVFSVDAPLMGRPLSDFSEALVHFHEAQRITEVPFPFPFNMALQLLLITHWLLTPLVVSSWTSYVFYSFCFCFGGSFSLWFFVALAIELDTPFAHTRNSMDMRYLQVLLNQRLLTALDVNKKPPPKFDNQVSQALTRQTSERGAWESLAKTANRRTTRREAFPLEREIERDYP